MSFPTAVGSSKTCITNIGFIIHPKGKAWIDIGEFGTFSLLTILCNMIYYICNKKARRNMARETELMRFVTKLHKESEARQRRYDGVKSALKLMARAKKGEVAHGRI